MLLKEKEGISWLEFELLSEFPEVVHAIFLKKSIERLHSKAVDALSLEQLVLCSLGLSRVITTLQCHGIEIGKVPAQKPLIGDGLFTQQADSGLAIWHADCQAALFYDPVKRAICNVHCGWRGNVQNIYRHAVHTMHHQLGCSPKDLRVCIGPSLGPEASEFINYRTEFPESFFSFQWKPYYFDLWEISRAQLLAEGVLPEHIEIARLCTFADPTSFFSYRRDRTALRNVTLLGLK